jgi:hypothetical protein
MAMTRFRAILGAVGLSSLVTASLVAFVTLSVPAVRDDPRLGLAVATAVFVAVALTVAIVLVRRK